MDSLELDPVAPKLLWTNLVVCWDTPSRCKMLKHGHNNTPIYAKPLISWLVSSLEITFTLSGTANKPAALCCLSCTSQLVMVLSDLFHLSSECKKELWPGAFRTALNCKVHFPALQEKVWGAFLTNSPSCGSIRSLLTVLHQDFLKELKATVTSVYVNFWLWRK